MKTDLKDLIVVIPHYNNPDGLYKTLSTIQEEFTLDIVVVDDGSKTKFDKLVAKSNYINKGRISFINLEKNCGIEKALNEGIIFAIKEGYKYIARIDCGDLCIENRFYIQRKYFDENPNIMLVGSGCEYITEEGIIIKKYIPPFEREDILKKMYYNTQFEHPTVMFNLEVVKGVGMYPLNFKAAEDFAYFTDITLKFPVSNITDILVKKIVDDNSISAKKRKLQVLNRIKVIMSKRSPFNINYFLSISFNVILLVTPRKIINTIKRKLVA